MEIDEAKVSEGNFRDERRWKLHVGDDLNTIVLPDTDTRVGGSEIDSIQANRFRLATGLRGERVVKEETNPTAFPADMMKCCF